MTDRLTNCIVCGKPIEQGRMGRPRKTCSAECRADLYRQRHPEVVVLTFSHIGDRAIARLPAPASGRGDDYRLAMEQALFTIERVLRVFNTPKEQEMVWAAVQRWAKRPPDPLSSHLKPVIAKMQAAAR